jgi:hypothetical protein
MGFADLTPNSSPSSNWTEAQIVLGRLEETIMPGSPEL